MFSTGPAANARAAATGAGTGNDDDGVEPAAAEAAGVAVPFVVAADKTVAAAGNAVPGAGILASFTASGVPFDGVVVGATTGGGVPTTPPDGAATVAVAAAVVFGVPPAPPPGGNAALNLNRRRTQSTASWHDIT